ncbi:MAG TPA: hypothetical protein VNK89_02025 [Thermoflexus sp.]|nr:hypothetical protein [Thermoflexus sp.]
MSSGTGNGSGSRLPLALGGGCAGLALVGLACAGLFLCGILALPALGSRGPVQPAPRPGVSQPGPRPGSQPGSPPGPQSGPQPGSQPGPQSGSQSGPQAGPQPGPQPGLQPGSGPQSGFTITRVGGYTCDLNSNQCQQLGPGEVIQVIPQGDGTVVLQIDTGAVRVDPNCRLVDQPAYTFFPCPFFPNVQSFQGILITPQGATPINSPFQFLHFDTDEFDQDGEINEPGYLSQSSGGALFVAYRPDGLIKFAGYIVETRESAYLYVFFYQPR